MRTRLLSRLPLALPCLALVAGCGRSPVPQANSAPVRLPTVSVATATLATLTETLPADAVLAPLTDHTASLNAPVSGALQSLPVKVGQAVARGQLVAQMATGPLRGQIMQAQAALGQSLVQVRQAEANALQQQAQTRTAVLQARSALASGQAVLAGARATLIGDEATEREGQMDLTRMKALFGEGLVAQKDVEDVELAARTAQAQADAQKQTVAAQAQTVAGLRQGVLAAQAGTLQDAVKHQDILVAQQQVRNASGALATIRAQQALYSLRAPIAGQVTFVGASAGETVDPTTKIVTITDPSSLQLQIAVPGADVAKVQPGQDVVFTIPSAPRATFHSLIRTISPQVDPNTGTVTALAGAANPNGRLQANETVKAEIIIRRLVGVVAVPQAALLTDPQTGATTVVTVADKVAHVVSVQTGFSVGGRTEIVRGLTPGQNVAVSGQYGLPDGAQVQIGARS